MTNDGKAFERAVETTLRLIGYMVSGEQLLGTKKVDLVATQNRWGAPWRTAVECKDEAKARGRTDVALIWSDYEELVRRGLVNEVLLVTRRDLTPAAKAFVQEIPSLAHRTLDQLRTGVMDFGDYLGLVALDFLNADDGLEKYFIPPRIAGGEDLFEAMRSWIDGTPGVLTASRPIAILGAYGIGKSSYARWLASLLAQEALQANEKRIPILIPLGSIGKEQSLEGLIGAHLTARYSVQNYSFTRFMELNSAGAFVLILDGFDEMKHQITDQEFRFNFKEFSRLISGDSRVVLLGRPTAFENDEEQESLLHGDPYSTNLESDYQEIELAPFGKADMRSFVQRYLESIGKGRHSEAVIEMVTSDRFTNIASRPVQLKMLAQVLPDYAGNLDDLDLATLYDLVVDDLITTVMRREEDKASRLAYSRRERRSFLQSVAYWMWTERGTSTPSMVPNSLVETYARPGVEISATRRDLVTASPLHRGYGDKLHFPHRSFQEHLVAAEILKRLRDRIPGFDLKQVDELMTAEVSEFLRAQTQSTGEAWAEAIVALHKGTLSWHTTRWLSLLRETERISAISPWGVLLEAIPSIEGRKGVSIGRQDKTRSRENIWAMATAESDPRAPLLGLFMVLAGTRGAALGAADAELLSRLVSRSLNSVRPVSYSWFDLIADHPDDKTLSQEQRTRRRQSFASENEWARLSRLAIKPLGQSYVESVQSPGRYGLVSPGSHLEQFAAGWRLVGKSKLEVRWFSDVIVTLARQSDNEGRVLCAPLRQALVSTLSGYAWLKSWNGPNGSSLAAHVRLPKYIHLQGAEAETVLSLRRAIHRV